MMIASRDSGFVVGYYRHTFRFRYAKTRCNWVFNDASIVLYLMWYRIRLSSLTDNHKQYWQFKKSISAKAFSDVF